MTFLPSFMCSLDATAEPPFRGFESLACAAVAWLTLAFSGDAHANPIAAATPAMILLRKLYLRRVDDRSDRTDAIGRAFYAKKMSRGHDRVNGWARGRNQVFGTSHGRPRPSPGVTASCGIRCSFLTPLRSARSRAPCARRIGGEPVLWSNTISGPRA